MRDDGKDVSGIEYVIDISDIEELRYIKETPDKVLIGPLTTHEELASSPVILKYAAFLAEASSQVGSHQIRSRGTIGGNIINASPAADTVPVMVALNATLLLKSLDTTRQIQIADIFEKPYKTNIKFQELLAEIQFPKPSAKARTAFIKLGRRNSLAISRMNVAVLLELNNHGEISDISIAPGSVTPTPQRMKNAEELLKSKNPDEELIERAARLVSEEMIKQSGIRHSTKYKEPVIQNLTIRAIISALGVKQNG